MSATVDHAALLRRHGVQVTAQRLAVLGAVSERSRSTVGDIDAAVRASIGTIWVQAVYDALEVLADAVERSGYETDEAEVIYWGRCPDCLAAGRDKHENAIESE